MIVDTQTRKRLHSTQGNRVAKRFMTEDEYNIDLLRGIAAGDEAALHGLYAAYGQRLYAYALRLTNDPAQAEDVVQDALVVIWRTAGRFRGEGRVIAWLLSIVHHTAMKALRHPSISISEEIEENLPSLADSPEARTQAAQQAKWVHQGLQNLSPEHRQALELVFYQGLSLEETAKVCHCPLGTIKSRLSYARQRLRAVLSSQDLEEWR